MYHINAKCRIVLFSFSPCMPQIKFVCILCWFCSGVIGFLLCSTEGPPVDFINPANPIEKIDGALKYRRELRFYNSDVSFFVF